MKPSLVISGVADQGYKEYCSIKRRSDSGQAFFTHVNLTEGAVGGMISWNKHPVTDTTAWVLV